MTSMSGAALMLPADLNHLKQNLWAQSQPQMAIATGKSDKTEPEKLVTEALKSMGGMKRFVGRGDVVVIKPNMAWDRTPEYAANTNPEVVASLIKMCFDCGASKVKLFDHTVNDTRRSYRQSGIQTVAENLGATMVHMDQRKFKEMKINGNTLKKWPVYTELFEADRIINVPIAKHHSKSRLTMSIKNWMGVIGGRRSKLHWNLDENLVDLARFIKPTLTVLDAVRILTNNGPQGGSLAYVKRLNTIAVGTDQVAVDSFGCTLFGMTGNDLKYVRLAGAEKLGEVNFNKLNIKKVSVS